VKSQPLIRADLESSPRGTNSKKRGPKTAATEATKLAAQAAGVSLRTMQRVMAASSNHKPRHRIHWLDRKLKSAAESAAACYEDLKALKGFLNNNSYKKKLDKIDTSLENATEELKNRRNEWKRPKAKGK